jgi:hypothetical protein
LQAGQSPEPIFHTKQSVALCNLCACSVRPRSLMVMTEGKPVNIPAPGCGFFAATQSNAETVAFRSPCNHLIFLS